MYDFNPSSILDQSLDHKTRVNKPSIAVILYFETAVRKLKLNFAAK